LPDLPLRVGLITSRGSAADKDFRTGLEASGYGFAVMAVDCRMQGEQVAPQVAAALSHLATQDLDVIVITRGGGSRADLSWFDQQSLCEAVARCPVPVVAAIGHEIDTSLVDLCAHTRCKTPTAAAEFLADRVRRLDERVGELARQLASLTEHRLETARRRLEALAASLEARTGRAVARQERRLTEASGRIMLGVDRRLAAAGHRLDYLARQVCREAPRAVALPGPRLDLLAEKVRLLDPARLLERGFTLSLDATGRPLRRAADVKAGQTIRTRFADGEVSSTVHGGRRQRSPKRGQGGNEEDPGQQALF